MSKTVQPTSKAADASAASEVQTGPANAAPSRYSVRLMCPTPLAHKELVVEASSADEAQAKYCEANGISGSDSEWRIEPTDQPATELKK